jgi:hypothetical protein
MSKQSREEARAKREREAGTEWRDHSPPNFQRWPLLWFECPDCKRRTFAPVAQFRLERSPFRLWCERCGKLSGLRGPRWLLPVTILMASGLSILAMLGALEVFPFDVAVLGSFAVFLATWALLNRLLNSYALE